MEMEPWVPLLNIFLNSPSPEGEASQWMQQSFDASNSNTITANSFLSLLTKPIDVIVDFSSDSPSSSSHLTKRIMWIQTLPNAVQSRILSFLTYERRRFSTRDLSVIANNILKGNQELDFWVKKAAHNLLDAISYSNFEWVAGLSLDSIDKKVEEEFEAIPSWLQSNLSATDQLLPWLPVSYNELNPGSSVGHFADEKGDNSPIEVEKEGEGKRVILNQMETEIETIGQEDVPLCDEIQKKAAFLKSQILTFESTSKTVGLANEILQLCFDKEGRRGDSFVILGLIQPWEADDETTSILISHLSSGKEQDIPWSNQILCSIVLPKLLLLREPASRVLLAAMIEFCKLHQKATVEALLFPLILRKGGITTHICDVVTRIIRECLHPAHVSSFCQKLLCEEQQARRFMCLHCHQCLISNELVWTEPLFILFQNILNQNINLTRDSVDHLVSVVLEMANRYSKSLKFGNFVLCLVTKCDALLKSHKLLLTEAIEQTNTFMTKSILSKLGRL